MGQIVLENVRKEFGNGVVAVDDVDMTIAEGEFMVLVGPSGCGKTTLLRSIGGLEKITSGHIRIGDRDVTRLEPADRDLAMVFQNYALYPHMTVRKNLGYGLRVRKTSRPEIKRRVDEVAKMLGLEEMLDRRPGQLSGGQQQRVAMGRAIIREPEAFLMDEPLSNLDAKLRVGMRTSLQQLHARLGTTTVYVTHDQVEAMTLGMRVAVMRDGRVQQVDVPTVVYDKPANLFVAAFIGSPAMNLVRGRIDGDHVVVGADGSSGDWSGQSPAPGFRVPLDRDLAPNVPRGEPVIVGIRPEAFEDAEFAEPGLTQIDVQAAVIESIGADAFVFFELDAEAVVVEDAVADDPEEETTTLLADTQRTLFTARVDARTKAQVGQRVRLALDPSRLYFFSAQTGESLLHRAAAAS